MGSLGGFAWAAVHAKFGREFHVFFSFFVFIRGSGDRRVDWIAVCQGQDETALTCSITHECHFYSV